MLKLSLGPYLDVPKMKMAFFKVCIFRYEYYNLIITNDNIIKYIIIISNFLFTFCASLLIE